MAIDNATLAQLLGGPRTTGGAGAGSPYGAMGLLGNYLLQQGQQRPATTVAVPAQPMMGGGQRQVSLPATGGSNPFAGAAPTTGGAAGGGAATNSLGIDPLVAALLRAKLSRSMGGTGTGGTGFGL